MNGIVEFEGPPLCLPALAHPTATQRITLRYDADANLSAVFHSLPMMRSVTYLNAEIVPGNVQFLSSAGQVCPHLSDVKLMEVSQPSVSR